MISVGHGSNPFRLQDFIAIAGEASALGLNPDARLWIERDHSIVLDHAAGDRPVYGLNTGLGSNLSHRIAPDEISGFQLRLLRGRAAAVGEPLPEEMCRGVLLARILSAARGASGISPALLDHLIGVFNTGLAPVIPEIGSIGAGDLLQNAHFGLALLGEGELWRNGARIDAATALGEAGLRPPDLAPGDAMVLANHSAVATTISAFAVDRYALNLAMSRCAFVLSFEGFAANRNILDPEVIALSPAPGYDRAAKWFRDALGKTADHPRRVQDPVSFRGSAQVTGAGIHGLDHVQTMVESALNGVSDSPVVTPDGRLLSTPNFQAPALALGLESLSLTLSMMANCAVQRIQKIMSPATSGLPRFLSPVGGYSAGMVPLQKTAVSLAARIRHRAEPVVLEQVPVSEGVEDMAVQTPLAASKLMEQAEMFRLLSGLEALIGAQALDLRKPATMGPLAGRIHESIRDRVAPLDDDRSLSEDIGVAADVIEAVAQQVLLEDRIGQSGT